MATLVKPKKPEEVQAMRVVELKKEYNKLADSQFKLLDGDILFCHCCNKYYMYNVFYEDKRYKSGFYPECKKCLKDQAMDYDKSTDTYTDNREKTIKVFQKLDLPFIDSLYESALKTTQERLGERTRTNAYQSVLTMVKSLDHYKKLKFADSDFGVGNDDDEFSASPEAMIRDSRRNNQLIKNGRKRFGLSYSREDLFWLENEYQDWIARYPCDSKAQETLFRTLCCQELERDQLRRNDKNTKDIDVSIQNTMTALGIKPSQSKADSLTDSLCFGELIEKWETEKPIPEPEDEFKDIDKIGLYIDVFFKGHLAKMMGLKNAFSQLYEKFMSKYRVTKPEVNEEEEEALFNQIFGSKIDENND